MLNKLGKKIINVVMLVIMLSSVFGPPIQQVSASMVDQNTNEETVGDDTITDVTDPDVTDPDVTDPDGTVPDGTDPDVTDPDVTDPDGTVPDVTDPDGTVPDVTDPDVTDPDVTDPGDTVIDKPVVEDKTVVEDTVFDDPAIGGNFLDGKAVSGEILDVSDFPLTSKSLSKQPILDGQVIDVGPGTYAGSKFRLFPSTGTATIVKLNEVTTTGQRIIGEISYDNKVYKLNKLGELSQKEGVLHKAKVYNTTFTHVTGIYGDSNFFDADFGGDKYYKVSFPQLLGIYGGDNFKPETGNSPSTYKMVTDNIKMPKLKEINGNNNFMGLAFQTQTHNVNDETFNSLVEINGDHNFFNTIFETENMRIGLRKLKTVNGLNNFTTSRGPNSVLMILPADLPPLVTQRQNFRLSGSVESEVGYYSHAYYTDVQDGGFNDDKWFGLNVIKSNNVPGYGIDFHPNTPYGTTVSGGTNAQEFFQGVYGRLRTNGYRIANHKFMGWSLTPDGPVLYQDGGVVRDVFPADTKYRLLYARWAVNPSREISYYKNDGTDKVSSSRGPFVPITLTKPDAFLDRPGYDFMHWNTKADGTGIAYSAGTVINPDNHLKLYAIWERQPLKDYRITFDPNGGTGTMPDQVIISGQVVKINPNKFSRTGYTLDSWTRQRNGTGASYSPGDEISLGSNITLYAQWKVNTHTVNFDSKGGSSVAPIPNVEFGKLITEPTKPTRTGYIFDGWYNGSAKWNFATNTMPDSDLNLYAKWTVNTRTVTFKANGGTGSMSNQTVNSGTPTPINTNNFTRSGYTFDSWNTQADGKGIKYAPGALISITSNTTLHAQWKINKHTLTFKANGGAGSMSNQTVNYGTPTPINTNTFTRSGYTFDSWNTQADGKGIKYAPGASISITSNTTLHAQWKINKHTLTFKANGGTGSMSNQTVDYGTPTPINNNTFTRSGYTFDSWNTQADGKGIKYAPGALISITSNTTLHAQWKINKHTLTFKANGGTGSMSNQTVNYGTPTPINTNTFTRSGYTFESWNTQADGKGIKYA
ncbi:MAG: InlB B-repeat-containing protein, partial [Mycoplasmatales bacterium]